MPVADEHADDRQRLVEYLLGSLPEEEADRLDELSIADDEFVWRLRAVENDLIDDYARGELSGQTLDRFRSAYLASSNRRERVAFAESFQALESRTTAPLLIETEASPRLRDRRVQGPARSGWQAGLAAAAVLALVAAGYLLVQNLQLRREMNQAHADRAALAQQTQALQSQLQEERSSTAGMREELSRVRDALAQLRPPTLASFLLLPATRGVGQVTNVPIPRGSSQLVLRLLLVSDDFPAYQASLKDPATGQILWRSATLTAEPEGERRVVTVTVPADGLKEQAYSLDLSGQPARGSSELLTSYAFRVVLK